MFPIDRFSFGYKLPGNWGRGTFLMSCYSVKSLVTVARPVPWGSSAYYDHLSTKDMLTNQRAASVCSVVKLPHLCHIFEFETLVYTYFDCLVQSLKNHYNSLSSEKHRCSTQKSCKYYFFFMFVSLLSRHLHSEHHEEEYTQCLYPLVKYKCIKRINDGCEWTVCCHLGGPGGCGGWGGGGRTRPEPTGPTDGHRAWMCGRRRGSHSDWSVVTMGTNTHSHTCGVGGSSDDWATCELQTARQNISLIGSHYSRSMATLIFISW